MARVRQLSDKEIQKKLKDTFKAGEAKMKRLKIEYAIADTIYQGLDGIGQKAGLDKGAASHFIYGPRFFSSEDTRVESCEAVRAMLFLHSKLCISDPVVTARSYNKDMASKKAAQFAEYVLLHVKNHCELQEKLESGPYLDTAKCGTGVLYVGWDTDAGDVLDVKEGFNPMKDEFTMAGDYDIRSVDPSKFYIDPTAHTWADADNCIEERILTIEELLFTFPDKEELFRKQLKCPRNIDRVRSSVAAQFDPETNKEIAIFEFWERAKPWNGMLGSRIIFVENEEDIIIIKRTDLPFKHKKLPFCVLTDIDVSRNPYGMGRVVYAAPIQEAINSLFSFAMANTELHGTNKMIIPEGGVNDDVASNNPKNVLLYNPATGSKPELLHVGNVTTDIWRLYDLYNKQIETMFGMSEFSQGSIPRELSSYAVQMAIETDDKFRIRLFNKKKKFIKDIYEMILSLTQQFVKEKRKLKMLGQEKIFDDEYFSAQEIEGDYGIFVDYGMYLPVDPSARKQQILELVKSGIYEKAGGDMRKLISILVDGDMIDIRDLFEEAKIVQDNETTKIISGEEVPVQEWHEHISHLESLTTFCNSEFFESLDRETQLRVRKHNEEHMNALAELQSKAQANGAPPAPGGQPGAPAAPMPAAQPLPPAAPPAMPPPM